MFSTKLLYLIASSLNATTLIPNLSVPSLSDSESVQFRICLILNLSDSDLYDFRSVRFQIYLIPNLSDSKSI
jgi:hypothetical protein